MLTFLLFLPVFSIPVAATNVNIGVDAQLDLESVSAWNNAFNFGYPDYSVVLRTLLDCDDVCWGIVDRIANIHGEVSLDRLYDICAQMNDVMNKPSGKGFLKDIFSAYSNMSTRNLYAILGIGSIKCEVQLWGTSGLYRIKDVNHNIWMVNSIGQYAYCDGSAAAATCGGNQWIGERSCSTAQVNMKSLDTLNLLCSGIRDSGTPSEIRLLGNYKAIWWNRQYYCDPEGRPFVCYANEGQAAINQPRPDTSVVDEEGNPVPETGDTDNSTNIDLSGMTIALPGGGLQIADAVIYDESTKTYYIDSHDTTNNYVTYNYSWTYNINYTSITYIGQTEEYDKYYKVYYELPDGRDSADLTPEEVEQLNVSIDCIGYARSSDDTALRSLYHFDGDTRDSSYWNYCTNFKWYNGASLTYMDAGVFNGALYLDETAHDFTITLPSAIGSADYSLQFRYYQSATAAPRTDSYIMVGGQKAFQFNGGYYLDSVGTSIAQTSTGSWNEIALIRKSGTLYFYINGVRFRSVAQSSTLTNVLQFVFGSAQQTYKYFDELRFTNYALTTASNYTCTSVPYDTNLSLVLPDSVTPIADEYVSWANSADLIKTYDFCKAALSFYSTYSSVNPRDFMIQQNALWYNYYLNPATSGSVFYATSLTTSNSSYEDSAGLIFSPSCAGLAAGSYDLIIYDVNRVPHRCPFTYNGAGGGVSVTAPSTANFATKVVNSSLIVITFGNANTALSSVITRADVVTHGGAASVGTLVTGVVPIPTAQIKKATLAVKTDIAIVNRQIGGVRPTYPEIGLVWAMVESGVIQSIQIYNGSAWESCDGRIWTGTRWVPYSSYNVITLQDFYDIADASGGSYEYIYTESGFWSWWQKSWNAFTTKLFAALGSGGTGNTSDTSPAVPDVDIVVVQNESKDNTNFLVKVLYKLFFKDAVSTVRSSAGDFASVFGVSVADSSASSSAASSSSASSSGPASSGGSVVTVFPLMDGDSIWD